MTNFTKTSFFKVNLFKLRSASKCRILQTIILALLFSGSLQAQVGIGTNTPQAFFNVVGGKDVLFGDYFTGTGKKLIWFGNKGAFRAGTLSEANWNTADVGENSFGFGQNVYVNAAGGIAMGQTSKVTGKNGVAIGINSVASGESGIALGTSAIAQGAFSTVLGFSSGASGKYSTAIGSLVGSWGLHSIVLGQESSVYGDYAVTIGYNANATGDYSFAMGSNVETNDKKGSFAFGDATQIVNKEALKNDMDHQMVMRFQNGYKLFTNYQATIGVSLAHGANAWSTTSDSTRKENFRKADGADFLKKISKMRLGSWNYKGQEVSEFRHYGPMAQDFYAAFGKDSLGTIGEDKSINQADFDGVNLIAIQALIKEVDALKAELAAAKEKETITNVRLDKIEALLNGVNDKTTARLVP